MTHEEWAKEVTGDSLRGIAQKIGVNQSNFSRQIKSGLSADRVIMIARAYNLNQVQALIDTGHIDEPAINTTPNEIIADLISLADRAKQAYPTSMSDPYASMPLHAVADNSPDEDAERGDAFGDH